jgi:intracellular septation protein A
MKNLLMAGRFLALDMASTLVLLVVLQLTHSIPLAAGIGIAIAFGQVGYDLLRKKPIHPMLWLSLILVVVSGGATLFTQDARFIMIKPSVVSIAVGLVMLKRGWMDRYLPPIAVEIVPDIAIIFGYVWAGSMFFAAALNIVLALRLDAVTWASAMSIYHTASVIGLFLIQYATMRYIGGRRRRAASVDAAGAVAVQA